jgi:hypothetical protein
MERLNQAKKAASKQAPGGSGSQGQIASAPLLGVRAAELGGRVVRWQGADNTVL